MQLYRVGPTQQRIQKGFVISGAIAEDDLMQLSTRLSLPFGKLYLGESRSRALWIDTGMVWLHTARARENCFRQLQASVQVVADAVDHFGGILPKPGPRTDGRDLGRDLQEPVQRLLLARTVRRSISPLSQALSLQAPDSGGEPDKRSSGGAAGAATAEGESLRFRCRRVYRFPGGDFRGKYVLVYVVRRDGIRVGSEGIGLQHLQQQLQRYRHTFI